MKRIHALLLIYAILLVNTGYTKPKLNDNHSAIKVMSYNVLFNSTTSRKSINLIRKLNPDIICLTELTRSFSHEFNQHLGKHYPYQAIYPKNGTWGVGILSKYPLGNKKIFAIRPHRIPGASAIVRIGKNNILISCIHLFPPAVKRRRSDSLLTTLRKNQKLRLQQAKFLRGKFRTWHRPLIMMGDMNESRRGEAIRYLLNNGYTHACIQSRHSSCGATYPGATSMLPAIFEIDHILGRNIIFSKAKVVKGGGSDHFPVIATFLISH